MNEFVLMLNNLNFKSLLKTESGNSWNPIAIEDIRSLFNINYQSNKDFNYKISKNLAYNLQYLEFLQKQIYELKLSEPLQKMLYKNYLITGMSIIETIFAFLIKNNNLWKKECWKLDKELSQNYQNSKIEIKNGYHYKTGIYKFKRVPQFEKELDFSDLIQIVRDNKIINNISKQNWKILNQLKKQRNRVHIRITNCVSTEYNDFNIYSYLNTKFFLNLILGNSSVIKDFEKAKNIFKFLSLTEDEKLLLNISK